MTIYLNTIDIRNYFQTANTPQVEDAKMRGFVEPTDVAALIGEFESNKNPYIKKNIIEVVKSAKEWNARKANIT